MRKKAKTSESRTISYTRNHVQDTWEILLFPLLVTTEARYVSVQVSVSQGTRIFRLLEKKVTNQLIITYMSKGTPYNIFLSCSTSGTHRHFSKRLKNFCVFSKFVSNIKKFETNAWAGLYFSLSFLLLKYSHGWL